MHSGCKYHCDIVNERSGQVKRISQRTPANIKRSSSWEATGNDLEDIWLDNGSERFEEGLQGGSTNTKEDENVNDQKLVISGHHAVMKGGKCRNRVSFFGDE